MAQTLTAQVRNIAEVATAMAHGEMSAESTVDVKGEILELKNTINPWWTARTLLPRNQPRRP